MAYSQNIKGFDLSDFKKANLSLWKGNYYLHINVITGKKDKSRKVKKSISLTVDEMVKLNDIYNDEVKEIVFKDVKIDKKKKDVKRRLDDVEKGISSDEEYILTSSQFKNKKKKRIYSDSETQSLDSE